MARKKRGWYGEPGRHRLARQGVKTKQHLVAHRKGWPFKFVKANPREVYTYEAMEAEEGHNLSKKEWVELKNLIGLMEVSDVFSPRDVARREELERKATEEELRYAWMANGLSVEEFEKVYY